MFLVYINTAFKKRVLCTCRLQKTAAWRSFCRNSAPGTWRKKARDLFIERKYSFVFSPNHLSPFPLPCFFPSFSVPQRPCTSLPAVWQSMRSVITVLMCWRLTLAWLCHWRSWACTSSLTNKGTVQTPTCGPKSGRTTYRVKRDWVNRKSEVFTKLIKFRQAYHGISTELL